MHNYKKIQDNKILKKICWGGKIWNSSIVGTLGYDQVPTTKSYFVKSSLQCLIHYGFS